MAVGGHALGVVINTITADIIGAIVSQFGTYFLVLNIKTSEN